MEKFWEWMQEKGLIKYDDGSEFDVKIQNRNIWWYDSSYGIWHPFPVPKQMLIGYMIEYLIENKVAPTPVMNSISNGNIEKFNIYYHAIELQVKELK